MVKKALTNVTLHTFKQRLIDVRCLKSHRSIQVSDKDQMLSYLCTWRVKMRHSKARRLESTLNEILNNTIFIFIDVHSRTYLRTRENASIIRCELYALLNNSASLTFTFSGAAATETPAAVYKHCNSALPRSVRSINYPCLQHHRHRRCTIILSSNVTDRRHLCA